MTFKRFEEIDAWKLARELCRMVKQYTEKEAFFEGLGVAPTNPKLVGFCNGLHCGGLRAR